MAKQREQVTLTSLEQVKPDLVRVIIDLGDSEQEFVVEMQAMSYARWEALADEIQQPMPPEQGIDANKRIIYNWNDPGYVQRIRAYQQEVALNRLIDTLTLEIPGGSRVEKRQYLREKVDVNALNQMIAGMTAVAAGGRARIETLSKSFQSDPTGDDENSQGASDRSN